MVTRRSRIHRPHVKQQKTDGDESTIVWRCCNTTHAASWAEYNNVTSYVLSNSYRYINLEESIHQFLNERHKNSGLGCTDIDNNLKGFRLD